MVENGVRDTAPPGCYASVSPPPRLRCGGPGWSEAGVLVPYAAYKQYGDTAPLRTHWASMERYMAYIADRNPNGLWAVAAAGYGDWASPFPDERTGGALIATAFWAADALAMRDMAHALRERDAEARYAALYTRIRDAFIGAYVTPAGVVGQPIPDSAPRRLTSQTSNVLALRYGLVPDSLRPAVVRNLVEQLARRGNHLATGFVGTPNLLPVLSANGRDDVAYALLLQESFPSWMDMINAGATTMWEYWNGALRPGTNSFNHYAYGTVGGWLIREAVGIGQDSSSVAFGAVVVHPHPDPRGRVTHLGAHYESLAGRITAAWTVDTAARTITVVTTIPRGQRARIDVPVRRGETTTYESHAVTGGTHRFTAPFRVTRE